MAKAAEFRDTGRRCHACKGPGWMSRFLIVDEEGDRENDSTLIGQVADFHVTCIGAWLMAHPDQSIRFDQGEV